VNIIEIASDPNRDPGSGCSLLDGRIGLDRIEWNAAHLPLHFGIISCVHGETPLVVAATASSRTGRDSSTLIVGLDIG
jgi:hypothetical protein